MTLGMRLQTPWHGLRHCHGQNHGWTSRQFERDGYGREVETLQQGWRCNEEFEFACLTKYGLIKGCQSFSEDKKFDDTRGNPAERICFKVHSNTKQGWDVHVEVSILY